MYRTYTIGLGFASNVKIRNLMGHQHVEDDIIHISKGCSGNKCPRWAFTRCILFELRGTEARICRNYIGMFMLL